MLTFTAPLLQHRGATPAQQERALMRRCLTMVSKIQNSKKKAVSTTRFSFCFAALV